MKNKTLITIASFAGLCALVSFINSTNIAEANEDKITNKNYVEYPNVTWIKETKNLKVRQYVKKFDRYIEYKTANGPILIIAQNEVSDEKILRAYNILSFYLTDFGNTEKPKIDVANSMGKRKAVLGIGNGKDGDETLPLLFLGQALYDLELPIEGDEHYLNNDYQYRDAGFEEILHLVHDFGIGTTSKPRVLQNFSDEIKKATFNALPEDKKKWGEEGIWGLGAKKWLKEIKKEKSLEQEYLATVIDVYYGLWEAFEGENGMWGGYLPKSREEMKTEDPMGYTLVSNHFFNPYLTYMARIHPDFEGTFSIQHDVSQAYTHKSQYLLNVRLLGKNNSNILGNDQDNIFIGNIGDNRIDGKAGNDVVQFLYASHKYNLSKEKGALLVTGEGNDVLIDIEVLRFTDKDILVKEL